MLNLITVELMVAPKNVFKFDKINFMLIEFRASL
jgi:hypothetical protein